MKTLWSIFFILIFAAACENTTDSGKEEEKDTATFVPSYGAGHEEGSVPSAPSYPQKTAGDEADTSTNRVPHGVNMDTVSTNTR